MVRLSESFAVTKAVNSRAHAGTHDPAAPPIGIVHAKKVLAKLEPDARLSLMIRIIFSLMVPSGAQRLHVRLLARIAQIEEGDYTPERLGQAGDAAAIQEALTAGDRARPG